MLDLVFAVRINRSITMNESIDYLQGRWEGCRDQSRFRKCWPARINVQSVYFVYFFSALRSPISCFSTGMLPSLPYMTFNITVLLSLQIQIFFLTVHVAQCRQWNLPPHLHSSAFYWIGVHLFTIPVLLFLVLHAVLFSLQSLRLQDGTTSKQKCSIKYSNPSPEENCTDHIFILIKISSHCLRNREVNFSNWNQKIGR